MSHAVTSFLAKTPAAGEVPGIPDETTDEYNARMEYLALQREANKLKDELARDKAALRTADARDARNKSQQNFCAKLQQIAELENALELQRYLAVMPRNRVAIVDDNGDEVDLDTDDDDKSVDSRPDHHSDDESCTI